MASRPPPAASVRRILSGIRADPGRAAAVSAARAERVAKLGLATDLMRRGPWLSLTPMKPSVPGKGWLQFMDADEVGRRWDTGKPVATFEAIFHKQDEGSFAIVRPSVILHLETDKQCLVEFAVWGNLFGTATTRFEAITGSGTTTVNVADAVDDEVAVLSRDFTQLRLWVPDGGKIGAGGGWAFYGATVTSID